MKINLLKANLVGASCQLLLILLSVVSCWLVSLDPANAQAIIGQKVLGSSGFESASAITITSDGNYVVAGTTTYGNDGDVSGLHGFADFWVVKLSRFGNIIWQKALGGTQADLAYGIAPTSDGGCVVVGTTVSNDGDVQGNHGDSDFWVVRLDQAGAIVWAKTFGGKSGENAFDIKATTDGNFLVVGSTSSNYGDVAGFHGGPSDAWVLKLSGNGDLLWQKIIGGSADDIAKAVTPTSDGGCVFAGYTSSNDGDVQGNHGELDFWIVRLDSSGSIVWQRSLGGSSNDLAYAITSTPDGGFVAVGYTDSNDGQVTNKHGSLAPYQWDVWVVKLTGTGNLVWQKALGGSGAEVANAVAATSDGSYFVFGYTTSTDGDVTNNHGREDGWVVKLSSVGEKIWQKTLGGSNDDEIAGVILNQQGQFILAGETFSLDGDLALANSRVHGNNDIWVVIFLVEPLRLLSPTYNCQTGAITFNTAGGDFSPITFTAPGISRSSPSSPTGMVEAGLRGDPKPIVIQARQGTQTATYVFDLAAACASPNNRLTLLQPTYNCETGAIHFNTTGGDDSPIEFRAPGITDWTTNPDQFVDPGVRTANDVQPFSLYARQNGVITDISWDLKAACGRARKGAGESSSTLGVRLLGNPVTGQQVELLLSGVAGQRVELRLVNLWGHILQQQVVQPLEATQRVGMDLRSASGIYFMEVVAGEQRKVVKLIKP